LYAAAVVTQRHDSWRRLKSIVIGLAKFDEK